MVMRLRRLQDLGSREVRWFVWTINTCVGKICRIRLKSSRLEGWRQAASSVQDAHGPCPVRSALPDTTVGDGTSEVESDDLKTWNFKGKRDFRGLILSSVLRRDPHAIALTLTFLSFSLHMENRR